MDQKQVCASVMRCLNRLRLTEAFCDITLLVGDLPIPAHKAVLAGTSKFFHSVLSSDQATDMFQINGMSAPDMVKVLDFLYTGQILVNKNNVAAIETMAEQLQIDILGELCSTFKTQQQKKAPPTKQAANTKGACRTRTYTRWGRQHTLRPGDSSGDEDSDNDELSLLGEDQDRGSGYSINMELTGAANCDRVQTEQILLESIRRAHIQSPKRKAAPKTQRNKPNKRQRTNTSGAHKLNTAVMAGFPQCKTSLEAESFNMGTPSSQGKVSHSLEGQDEVCPPSTLISGDVETHMNSAECLAHHSDEADQPGDPSNPIDTIMQEVCKVVDLAGISVYHQHDLTVTSISDAPAGHVLISDTGVESDLGSLLDIQSLLSSYSTSGQPIILTTCDEDGFEVTNDAEHTSGQPIILTTCDEDGFEVTNDAEQTSGQPIILTTCDEDGFEVTNDAEQTSGQPIILTTCDEDGFAATNDAEQTSGQPIILTTCDEDSFAATNDAEQTHCCVDLVAELDQSADPSGAEGLSQDLMLGGQPVILANCQAKGEEGVVEKNGAEQTLRCLDLVAQVGQSVDDDPSGVGGEEGRCQDLMMEGEPVILTTCEVGVLARNAAEQTPFCVDLVAEVDQTADDEPSGVVGAEGLCQDLIMAGQVGILTTCDAARNSTEQTPCDVDLVAEVGHHTATCPTEGAAPPGAEEESADLMMSSHTSPVHVSQCGTVVEAMDNLQPFDMSSISNPAEAEAGFHDYCLITDSVKVIQRSYASEGESRVSDEVDLTRERENEDADYECQANNSITDDDSAPGELEQDDVAVLLEPSELHSTYQVPSSSDCQEHDPSVSLKECLANDTSQTDINLEKTAETSDCDVIGDKTLDRSQRTDLNEVSSPPWNDAHVVIMQDPDRESIATNKKQRQKETTDDSSHLQCPWCTLTFTNSVLLRTHTKDSHPDSMYPCTFCTRTFIEEERRENHMDWCRVGEKVSGRFRCPQCTYSAAKALDVVNHYRVKHTTRCQRTCDRCHQVFNTLDNYYDHQLQVHQEDIALVSKRKVYVCSECEFRTVKAYLLKSHMIGHSEKRFSCKHCDKNFKTTMILKRHEKFIHSSELLRCSQCDYTSKYAATLKAHEYRTHDIKAAEQSVHHCHYCDYSHVDRSNLSKHERFKHSDERPFLCSFCPTSFKHKQQVTVHERSHTGLRPFQCSLCPYAGRSKLTLRAHHGYRHSDNKPFGCELCGFQTKAASNLQSHKARGCHKRHTARLKPPQQKKFSIALKTQPLASS